MGSMAPGMPIVGIPNQVSSQPFVYRLAYSGRISGLGRKSLRVGDAEPIRNRYNPQLNTLVPCADCRCGNV